MPARGLIHTEQFLRWFGEHMLSKWQLSEPTRTNQNQPEPTRTNQSQPKPTKNNQNQP